MLRVTFLEPPAGSGPVPERFAGCSWELFGFPDLTSLYPLTQLADAGVDVRLIDAGLDGYSGDALERWLRQDNSTHYLIHSVVLSRKIDIEWIRKIHAHRPDATVVVHGPEPTWAPEEYLSASPNVVVIRGEVEASLPGWLLHGRMDGLSVMQGGVPVHHPAPGPMAFDSIPIPRRDHPAVARHLFGHTNPKFRKKPYTILLGSRGCVHRCAFCVPIAVSFARELESVRAGGGKPPARVGSAPRVIEEVSYLAGLGFRSLMFMDDQFLWARERTFEICRGIGPLGIEWGMLSRANYLTDPAIVEALADAGCRSVDIGVESLDQELLDSTDKDLDISDVYRAVGNLNRAGIRPKLNIMFGTTPLDNETGIRRTVAELCRMDVDRVMFAIATPFRGTRFHDAAVRDGFLSGDPREPNPLGRAIVDYPHLSAGRLEQLVRFAYRRFYLRPGVVFRRLLSVRSFSDLLADIRIAWRVLLG